VFTLVDLGRWNPSESGIHEVVGIVGLGPRHPMAIPASEIESVRILAASRLASISAACAYLHEGERVRVRSGLLRGAEGFVLRDAGRTRLVMTVEGIQLSREIEVPRDAVERVVDLAKAA
jgi:transcription antitermination factor NusG